MIEQTQNIDEACPTVCSKDMQTYRAFAPLLAKEWPHRLRLYDSMGVIRLLVCSLLLWNANAQSTPRILAFTVISVCFPSMALALCDQSPLPATQALYWYHCFPHPCPFFLFPSVSANPSCAIRSCWLGKSQTATQTRQIYLT